MRMGWRYADALMDVGECPMDYQHQDAERTAKAYVGILRSAFGRGTKSCVRCAEKIPEKALVCSHCGAEQPKRRGKRILWTAVLLYLGAAYLMGWWPFAS